MVAKKSLIIFSVVMLLISMSFVSAGFFDWLTGDAVRGAGEVAKPTSLFNREVTSLTPTVSGTADSSSTFIRKSFANRAPILSRWIPVAAATGGTCYVRNS